MRRLTRENTSTLKNKSGVYRIYSDDSSKAVYVGSSKQLKHRLQSYHEKDDYNVNRTKRALRPHADKFTYDYVPIKRAREIEKREKKNTRFNYL